MKLIDLKYFPLLRTLKRDGLYQYFPIRVGWGAHRILPDGSSERIKGRWGTHAFLCCHGWQTDWKNGKRVYGWTLHIGMLKIMFGGKTKAKRSELSE